MSFEGCTGTTLETCTPPCSLVYNTNSTDPSCVPPIAALSTPLSDADMERIRELFREFPGSGRSTPALDAALKDLHSNVRDYLNIRIRQHVRNARPVPGGDMWNNVLTQIVNEVLNDVSDLKCFICRQIIDDTEEPFILECRFPDTSSIEYNPMHLSCMHKSLETYSSTKCPKCRRLLRENHNRVPPIGTLRQLHRRIRRTRDAISVTSARQAMYTIRNSVASVTVFDLLHAAKMFFVLTLYAEFIRHAVLGARRNPLSTMNQPPNATEIFRVYEHPVVNGDNARSIVYLDAHDRPILDRHEGYDPQNTNFRLVPTDPLQIPWEDPMAMPAGFTVGDLGAEDFIMGHDGRWYIITDSGGRPFVG